jgi:hypothetical protein
MKKILLTRGKYTLVDDEDFEYLNQWKWHVNNTGYAMRSDHIAGEYKHKNILMHRLITNAPSGYQIDHINHNTLDNRKSNLRIVTLQQNHFNMKTRANSISGYKGVTWFKQLSKWRVRIMVSRREVALGYYDSLEKAIEVRKNAERIYHAI